MVYGSSLPGDGLESVLVQTGAGGSKRSTQARLAVVDGVRRQGVRVRGVKFGVHDRHPVGLRGWIALT